jgi:hypothetical protein
MSSPVPNLFAAKDLPAGQPPAADAPQAAALAETAAGPEKPEPPPEASAEQVRFAAALEKGTRLGLLCLLLTFPLYIFGVVEPCVPIGKVSESWILNVHQYHDAVAVESGWSWLSLLGHGDFLNFIGITILAGTTVISYLAIVPLLLKRGDILYIVLALLQVLVLVAAASGLIAAGH